MKLSEEVRQHAHDPDEYYLKKIMPEWVDRIEELESLLQKCSKRLMTTENHAEELEKRNELQAEALVKITAENKRLRSELKAAGKGAERNAHINVMLVDKNKRLRSQIKQQDTETIPEEVDNGT